MTTLSTPSVHEVGKCYFAFCDDDTMDVNNTIIEDDKEARERIGLSQTWLRNQTYFMIFAIIHTYLNLEERNRESQLYPFLKNHVIRLRIQTQPKTKNEPMKWTIVKYTALAKKDVILTHSPTYHRDMSMDCLVQLIFENVDRKCYYALTYADFDGPMKTNHTIFIQYIRERAKERVNERRFKDSYETLICDFNQHTTF